MSDILLVESEPRVREQVAEFLAADGHSLRGFGDAAVALGALEGPAAGVALAIVAWDLPGDVSGAEFLSRMRQRAVTFPWIVISATLNLKTRNAAIALGAKDLVMKPIDSDRLRQSVRRALSDPVEVDPLVRELRQEIIGGAPAFLEAVVKLAQAIRSPEMSVLLIGETGSGKEVFARQIHKRSRLLGTPLVALNVSGLSATLIESELFGHDKGAFTGAVREHAGAFERAGRGTLFLDEIGDLDVTLQPKLLRAIEQRRFLRVGGSDEQPFEARLVCATGRNLIEAVKAGAFREDLYYRISEFEIRIPPLRSRHGDLRLLAEHFLGGTGCRLERETLAVLESYSFPGNVRELQNVLRQACAVCGGESLLPAHVQGEIMGEREAPPAAVPSRVADVVGQGGAAPVLIPEAPYRWPESLFAMKREAAVAEIQRNFDQAYLLRKIAEAGGNREKAAQQMGITPKTLRQKLRDCGLGHLVGREEDSR